MSPQWMLVFFAWSFWQRVLASPMLLSPLEPDTLERRTDPFFPDQPASCPICAKDYASIRNCAEAAPVLQNFTMVIFNPGAFIDTIQCACGETFKAVFPQCVDCFIQTDQEYLIMEHGNLPAVVEGVREVCAVASTILGNVTDGNNDPDKQQSSTVSTLERIPSLHSTAIAVALSVVASMLSL